ncbi:MAG: manganese efflux pump MntP family protein [Anaerobiospirillum succiniciproducens]|uniref:manganese efflux pump MntP n=1 Tax=Anaerobiospirillum succiniciproducens TaxID=13335 RepID=UPI0026DD30A2|nr:manganese efflux pump MntP family protein [Anaerobiospirillum succiniciproducens]MDO4676844.1 manganese efflux pump MntP family protein [Anaerobiospirillum succiniciproducens]
MSFSEILIVAFALAVDALVCSIITGKSSTNRLSRIVTGLTVALTFGFFQFLMPVIGFFAGKQLENTLAAVDHWIAFVLLAGVGANMLKEAFSSYLEQRTQEAADSSDTLSSQPQSNALLHVGLISLISMAIGTSIDALAVGVSYGLVGNTIWLSAIVIGLVCFALSLLGFFMGQILSTLKSIDPILNVLGALVLISIGINILIEHQAMAQLTHLFA